MESKLKSSINKEMRSTRQQTSNPNDFSFHETILEKQLFENDKNQIMKNSVPVNLTKIKSETLLHRKRSCEFSINFLNDNSDRQTLKNSKCSTVQNQILSIKSLHKKATSDPNILKTHQRDFSIEIAEKRKKLEERKKEKINFINDKINKLKTINDKLNSLKDEIVNHLTQEKQPEKNSQKQYYIGDLIKSSNDGTSQIQKNSAHFIHFEKGFNLLKHLQNQHHLISRPPQCQKILKNPAVFIQPLPTLVLDLDQTLVWTEKTDKLIVMNSIYLKDKASGRSVRHEVYLRPFVDKFLQEAAKIYEIVIFTAGSYEYTNQIIKLLDPQRKFISRVLARDHTTKFSDDKYEIYIKDLRVLGKNLTRTVFVDNCIYSYALQLENGIPILPFNGDPTDYELKHLLQYLKQLQNYSDMASQNDEIFKQSLLHAYFPKKSGVEELIRSLYQNDNLVRNNIFHRA